jgi:hypothetical protein
MKNLKLTYLLFVCILLSSVNISAREYRDSANNSLTFQLYLLQNVENGKHQSLAIGISAKNSSGQNVYSQSLRLELLNQITIYKKSDGFKYEKMDRDIYNKKIPKDTRVLLRNSLPSSNALTKGMNKPLSIFENDVKLANNITRITEPAFTIGITGCLFIGAFFKAGASINDLVIIDLDWLSDYPGEYEFFLATEDNLSSVSKMGSVK